MAEYLDDAIKQVFRDKPKDEIKIMDAGAGTGSVGVELGKLGYTNLHALDISQEMLDEAKKKTCIRRSSAPL
jgi:ubiquinone/menaquinone biosynthesis C-methylase UbiE